MNLPNEVYLLICESLSKSDLKSVRQVTKLWSPIASTFLFQQIYVSANKEDLEVFENITKHSCFSSCVRSLVYDGACSIQGLTKRDYLEELLVQSRGKSRIEDTDTGTCAIQDPDIRDWLRFCKNNVDVKNASFKEFRSRTFITTGYKRYSLHATSQQKLIESGTFSEALVKGLKSLGKLQSVCLSGFWHHAVTLEHCRTGTPLARKWDNFHCCPHMWAWDNEEGPTYTNGSLQYQLITTALRETQRYIHTFDVNGPGIPASIFERSRSLDCAAFANLTSLNLTVAAFRSNQDFDEPSTCERFPDVGSLAALLTLATSLVDLSIDLPQNYLEPPVVYKFEEVFPLEVHWNNLESLRLQHFTIAAKDLVHLVRPRMPKLKLLEMDEVVLHRGRWESVFQALRELPNPPAIEFLGVDIFFWHQGFDMCHKDYDLAIYPKVEKYVKNGGRHPCLPEGEPDSAAKHLFHATSEKFGFMV